MLSVDITAQRVWPRRTATLVPRTSESAFMANSSLIAFEEAFVVMFDRETSQEQVIRRLAATLEAEGCVKPTFADAVLEREKAFPTGLPTEVGIALPHTDVEHVMRNALSIGVLRQPIAFGQMGGGGKEVEAHLVCLLAISEKEAVVNSLSRLVSALQDGELLNAMRNATSRSQVVDLLVRALPDLVAHHERPNRTSAARLV